MKNFFWVLCAAILIFCLGAPASGKLVKLRTKRINIKDLPQTELIATRYSHVSGLSAVVLDVPDDNVQIVLEKANIEGKEQGLSAPQLYIDTFFQKPQAYRFESKEDGTIYGYFLYAGKINWLAKFDKGGKTISINITGNAEDQP